MKSISYLAASLFSFYNLLLFSLMNVLSIYLMEDFHLSKAQIGVLGSWDLWGNVLAFIPLGIILDRFSVRYVAMSLLSLAIIATASMAFASEFWILCILRCLQGFASACSLLVLMRLGTSAKKSANKLIGMMILIAFIGGVIGNSVFARLTMLFGWQHAMLCIALIGVIILLFMAFNLYDPDDKSTAPHSHFKVIFSKAGLWGGIQIGILSIPVFFLGSLFGNKLLIDHFQLDLAQASNVSSLIFLGIMFGSPVVGYLADRFNSILMLGLGYLSLLVLSIYLLSGMHSYSVIAGIFFLLGVASCTQNLIYPLIAKADHRNRSAAMGMACVIFNAIGALVQILGGLL